MDFDDALFVRYAVEFRCLNPVADTKISPLPPLEELAEAITTLTVVGILP